MPKHRNARRRPDVVEALNISAPENRSASPGADNAEARPSMTVGRFRIHIGIVFFCFLIGLGVMASNNWLPHTDSLTGKRTGWFGQELSQNAVNVWNPFALPTPSPTPQLSKEYVYAGSRLLAAEDKHANAAPPGDVAVWRPATGVWYVLGATSYTQYGLIGDVPAAGDYDGDGQTDFAVARPSDGNWYVKRSSDNGYYSVAFGTAGDLVAPADFDGDGKTDMAFYRPSTATWHILQSSSGSGIYPVYGLSTDKPAPADYDGDGKADLGVWRSSNNTFYSLNSSNGGSQSYATNIPTSDSADKAVSGDYDGDGKADFALFQNSSGIWYIKKSSTGQPQTPAPQWGQAGDVPVPNDYDADGKVDITVWRPLSKNATWYIFQSSTATTRVEGWGQTDDIPVPVFYRR